MTTTNAANASKLQPPTKVAGNAHAGELTICYFRQTGDAGANFTVTPVYLQAGDAAAAVSRAPKEWSFTTTFPAWSGPNNAGQAIGGRGRLLGASLPAD